MSWSPDFRPTKSRTTFALNSHTSSEPTLSKDYITYQQSYHVQLQLLCSNVAWQCSTHYKNGSTTDVFGKYGRNNILLCFVSLTLLTMGEGSQSYSA